MKATCLLCAVAFVLLLDLFTQTCADESKEDQRPSSSWLAGNRMFHDIFQRQSRWGGRQSRPRGRIPRSYEDEDEDEFNVFRRWGSRRMPYKARGGGSKRAWEEQIPNADDAQDEEFKRDDGRQDGMYQYARN